MRRGSGATGGWTSNTVGRILSVLRQLRGLTQEQLAERSGLNKTAISDYETGRRDLPEQRRLQLLGGLGLPARAWDETARHLEWLSWLSEHHRARTSLDAPGRGPVEPVSPRPAGAERGYRIRRVAEAAGRDLERHLLEVLDIVSGPGG